MGIKRLNRIFRSVFTKLLLIIILAGFCINLLVIGFSLVYRHLAFSSFGNDIIQYVNYIIIDLGTPPSLERARAITRDSALISAIKARI